MKLSSLLIAGLVVSLAPFMRGNQVASADDYRRPWMPHIAIVWPHDGQGNPTNVAESRAVNVAVWPQTNVPVECEGPPTEPTQAPVLLMAVNNEPAVRVAVTPKLVLRTANGVTFPSLEYNDVPADLAANPASKLRFVTGAGTYLGNAWVHAVDARTFSPNQVIPTGYTGPDPKELDIRIQVVWPHDGKGQVAPVDKATFVNIAVDIFEHGTTKSVPPDYELTSQAVPGKVDHLLLHVAKDNDPMLIPSPQIAPTASLPERVTYTVNGQTFPRWVFNDIPVEPGRQYHFTARPSGSRIADAHPSIWTHASDARTYLPAPELPPSCTSGQ